MIRRANDSRFRKARSSRLLWQEYDLLTAVAYQLIAYKKPLPAAVVRS